MTTLASASVPHSNSPTGVKFEVLAAIGNAVGFRICATGSLTPPPTVQVADSAEALSRARI